MGDNNSDGSLSAADVPTTSGYVWIKGNVGIGTTTTTTGKLVVAGVVDVSSNKIINVATPTNSADAANKAYVDAATGGGCYEVFGSNSCAGSYTRVVNGYTTVYSHTRGGGYYSAGGPVCSPITHDDISALFSHPGSLDFEATSRVEYFARPNNEPCAICCK